MEVEVLFEVLFHVFEDQVQLLLQGLVDYIPQTRLRRLLHDVRVLELLKDRDLPHRSAGDAFVFVLKSDFLLGHHLVGQCVQHLEHHPVGAYLTANTLTDLFL